MKSTGEVMGMDATFEAAYLKSQLAAGQILPRSGGVFLSAKDRDKKWVADIGQQLVDLDYRLIATEGTAAILKDAGLDSTIVHKLAAEQSPTIIDLMTAGEVQLIINTPSGLIARQNEVVIRSQAILRGVPIVTTHSGAVATVAAIRCLKEQDWDVQALQDYFT